VFKASKVPVGKLQTGFWWWTKRKAMGRSVRKRNCCLSCAIKWSRIINTFVFYDYARKWNHRKRICYAASRRNI